MPACLCNKKCICTIEEETLEDLRKKRKNTFKKKPPREQPGRTGFLPLWYASNSEDFVQMNPLRNIWYCSYWISFPISDFKHDSALNDVYMDCAKEKHALPKPLLHSHLIKRLSQRMFLFSKIFEQALEIDGYRFWGLKKGIVVYWLSHPPRPVLHIYITTVAQEHFSVYM